MSFYEHLFVRSSLFYLLYTTLTGTAFYVWPGLIPYFKPSHVHAGLVGFFLCMVMGVAFWMMPRPGQIRQDRLEALAFFILNAGLLLRLIVEPWLLFSGNRELLWLLVTSGLLQTTAIAVFAYAMSKRVLTKEKLFELAERRKAKNNQG
ncbi:MAG: hypothetical protein KatS3mg070_1777 [Meiothermus sp.]|uniref:hypothetical protein n=1 Tax=Meiothermus sp. TaxID=1955249 RepID=UPI0021DDF976|nr:hypothetical protein [Meiothermus sp.]GIW28414.1 MAG: hypothetical protein KatS3mg070_1777 [Meiothermus sp.]